MRSSQSSMRNQGGAGRAQVAGIDGDEPAEVVCRRLAGRGLWHRPDSKSLLPATQKMWRSQPRQHCRARRMFVARPQERQERPWRRRDREIPAEHAVGERRGVVALRRSPPWLRRPHDARGDLGVAAEIGRARRPAPVATTPARPRVRWRHRRAPPDRRGCGRRRRWLRKAVRLEPRHARCRYRQSTSSSGRS